MVDKIFAYYICILIFEYKYREIWASRYHSWTTSRLTQNEVFYIHVHLIRDKVYGIHCIFKVIYNPSVKMF